jgi:hypothetical protein
VEQELANWLLFARCMGNDGLIALAIDDAGPTLSGLVNDLLLACYGPRFTVAIETLHEHALALRSTVHRPLSQNRVTYRRPVSAPNKRLARPGTR